MGPRPVVRVTEIGEYIRYRSCDRRFKLGHDNRRLAKGLPFATRLFNTLDPVLQEVGKRREDEWEASLKGAGFDDLTQQHSELEEGGGELSWDAFVEGLQGLEAGREAYGREVKLAAELGAFRVEGRADFVLVLWREGRPRLRIVECKASRRDKTYHRVQVALYGMMVRRMLRDGPIRVAGVGVEPEDVECVVARIDEGTNRGYSIPDLKPLDLSVEEADLERLLGPDGSLTQIVGSDLDELAYQLDVKCDGCVFNVHCFPESARQRRLQLVGLEPSSVRTLRAAGVRTIDDLASLDPSGPAAAQARQEPGFAENLTILQRKASARRSTLPGGREDPDSFEVEALPNAGQGRLPLHEDQGHRLVRVYLSVDYDYTENRIGALSAHVTTSDGRIHTGYAKVDGRWRPEPGVMEIRETGRDEDDRPVHEGRALRGREIVEIKASEWTGDLEQDTGAEREMIQGFLLELIDAIAEEAGTDWAPVHFYVWSRSEVTQLVEACSRAGSGLLGHLRELLGCRESLEQLIYSCLQDEVDGRYGLGWTGRGLSVATSLTWYGRRYHWRRQVGDGDVDLDRLFAQDIFDFKTTLALDESAGWGDPDDGSAPRHRFEIRSRFHDSLTAPYWRAYWRALPNPEDIDDTRLKGSIRRYKEAAQPPHNLRAYLCARVHALRWVEESIRFKNPEIIKPALNLRRLQEFSLGVENAAQAAIDFLRLDQHVKVTDWISAHLTPPISRVPGGRTVPLRDVESQGKNRLSATISLDGYGLDREALAVRCTLGEGSFVRVSPHGGEPERGQTFRQLTGGGRTCTLDAIDWETGRVELSVIPSFSDTEYVLFSGGGGEEGTKLFEHATMDESVSDFVAGRVETKLRDGRAAYVYGWLDPEHPQLPAQAPLDEPEKARYESILDGLKLRGGRTLAPDQRRAVLEGLDAKVQLLQGPPGTGKTMTTAVAIMVRALARRKPGDVVLVAANTHTAVDNLLERIGGTLDAFYEGAEGEGFAPPRIKLAKVHSSGDFEPLDGVVNIPAKPSIARVRKERKDAVLVIGGTISALLKLARELSNATDLSDRDDGFQVPMLVVDEASMMVFPHFLALATLVRPDGEIMLAGDHRQLAPIVAHDWEREDRPPAVLYQPYASAYQAILKIIQNQAVPEEAARRSALSQTFRLPPLVCDL
ncbi:MAG: AAA family ATPase, partial [Actinomycetota bacterium]|nr:AAA family ATPase [Actinomycetota bacterium]